MTADPDAWSILLLVILLFWTLLALDRRRRWPSRWKLPPSRREEPSPGGEATPAGNDGARVTVIVPARNEAAVLGRSLPALLVQDAHLERVVLVDDHSSDDTAGAARKLAESRGRPTKLRIVQGRPLPDGWTGKLNALQSGVDAVEQEEEAGGEPAVESSTEGAPHRKAGGWFLFTDADILHPEDSIERLLSHAARGPYDLVSVMVRLRAESAWEKFLIPPFVYFFQLMYPFRLVSDARSRVAAAAGGCILVRRSLLEKIGGLASLRDAVIDDVTLARRAKRAGGRCWLGSEDEMLSLRGYGTLGEIVDMVARTAFTELGYRYALVPVTWAVLGVFFVSPPFAFAAMLSAGRLADAGLPLLTWGLEAASVVPVVRHLCVPLVWSATLPFAAAVYGAITGISAWRHFRGRGIVWRGRVHEIGAAPARPEEGRPQR
jgi:hopene-associated glycosyltransferase HpnB